MERETIFVLDNQRLKKLFIIMLACMAVITFFIWEKNKIKKVDKTKLVGNWLETGNEKKKILVIKEKLNKIQLVDDSLNLSMDIEFDGREGFILLGATGDKVAFKYDKSDDELLVDGEGNFRRSEEEKK